MKHFLLLFLTLMTIQASGQSYEWINHMGSPGVDFSNNVKMDKDGNTYISGFYREGGFMIGGDELPYVDNMDSFLAKLDAVGELIWVVPFYGKGVFDRTEGIEIDDDGNIYLLSQIQEVQNIGDQITLEIDSLNRNDILLLKFAPDGHLIWHKIYGGPESDIGYNFLFRDNDIVIAGHFMDTLHFDDIYLVSSFFQDMFIASLDFDGNVNWAKKYGSDRRDRLYEVKEHANGDLAVCGYSSGEWTFGETELVENGALFNGFTGRLTSDGEPLWAAQIFSTGLVNKAQVWSITTDNENNTYIATTLEEGNIIDSVHYDAKMASQFTVIKYSPEGEIDWLHVAEVDTGYNKRTEARTIKYADERIWVGGGISPGAKLFGKEYDDVGVLNMYIAVLDKSGTLITDFYDGGDGAAIVYGLEVVGEKILCTLYSGGEVILDGELFTTQNSDIIVVHVDFDEVLAAVDDEHVDIAPFVFPNPARDVLNVRVDNETYRRIEITDIMGRSVLISPVSSQIDIAHLLAGNYYVRFDAGTYSVLVPIVIVR
jgi:hypothetical protein